jgi:hypothetical protein
VPTIQHALRQGFLLDLLLIDGDSGCHLPLLARWAGVFAWTPLTRVLRMSYQVTTHLQPHGFALQLPFHSGSRVSATSEAPIGEMPALLLPGGLGTAFLSLHSLLGALERSLRAHDDSSFAPLRQGHVAREPVHGSIFGLLPGLAAFLQERFRLSQSL